MSFQNLSHSNTGEGVERTVCKGFALISHSVCSLFSMEITGKYNLHKSVFEQVLDKEVECSSSSQVVM